MDSIDFYPPKDNRYGPMPPKTTFFASVNPSHTTSTGNVMSYNLPLKSRIEEHGKFVMTGPRPTLSKK
jgi:hypothetical protein